MRAKVFEVYALPAFTWDVDRLLCERCTHLRVQGPAMNCLAVARARRRVSCIEARTSGGCGSKGRLFRSVV